MSPGRPRRAAAAFARFVASACACAALLAAVPPLAARDWRPGDSPDRLIVRWAASPPAALLDREARRLGLPAAALAGDLHRALHSAAGAGLLRSLDPIGVDIVRLARGSGGPDVDRALAAYLASPLVASAEPDRPVRKASFPQPDSDLYLAGAQPALAATGWAQAVQAYGSGAIQLQSAVTVALLDSGVNPHPELTSQGQLLSGGWNFNDDDADTADNDGHGTLCAGLMAAYPPAVTPPGQVSGIYGVFFDPSKIRVLPVKVLDGCGNGFMGNVASGVVYATAHGARVISMSIESTEPDEALEAAVDAAREADIVVVAAAGNDSGQTAWPAAYTEVLSVAALDHAGNPASYSNYGKVDLSAPGGDGTAPCACVSPLVQPPYGGAAAYAATLAGACPWEVWSLSADVAAVPGACTGTPLCSVADGFDAEAGTSLACPQVAAAAALLFSQSPGRRAADVQQLLLQSASATALGAGYNAHTGWGRLDIYGALSLQPATGPGAPLKVYNWPNPFSPAKTGLTTVTFFLPRPGAATLRILDAAGEQVAHWDLPASATWAGMNQLTWDGRNGRGVTAANGSYLLVLESGGQRAVNRVGLLQ